MISLVDTSRFRRAVSFNGNSGYDHNANELKSNKKLGSSFRRRLFRSMRVRRAGNSLDEASTSSSASSSSADVHSLGAMSGAVPRPDHLPLSDDGRNAISDDETQSTVKLRKTISSDTLLNERNALSCNLSEELRTPGSISSNSSNERKANGGDDVPRYTVKKKKYFQERNKNIIKKLLHPNYQERNAQYRKLFGNVVEDDDLFLISFSCAYQREILCQGRMYISQKHICFHANILGWETRLAIPIGQISALTKEKAALIFPNSIQIETLKGEKYFFASFVNREKSLTALNLVLKSIEAGSVVTPEDMWEKMNPDRNLHSNKSLTSSRHRGGDPSGRSTASSPLDGTAPSSLASPSADFPPISEGSSSMLRTPSLDDLADANCPCTEHFGKLQMDAVFPIGVAELYRMIFHDDHWAKKFNQVLRNTGYEASAWAKDKDGVEGRTCTYTMELNHAMAPKNCVVTEKQTIQHIDRQMDFVVVHKETQNSGVPYADHFTVICNYCLTRVGRNQTRLKVHGGLNYKKTIWSMVKGYIEKSTYQGLEHHYTALESTVNAECASRRTAYDEENESVASSIEDPAPETSRSFSAPSPERFVMAKNADPATDYSNYIRVIIGLLVALLFLQLLLLYRGTGSPSAQTIVDLGPLRNDFQELSKRLVVPPSPEVRIRETEMLQTLLSTVEQLAEELHKLKKEREEL